MAENVPKLADLPVQRGSIIEPPERPYTSPAVLAAERYRRARELTGTAKTDLIDAAIRERSVLNLAGLSASAGLDRKTLESWIRRREQDGS